MRCGSGRLRSRGRSRRRPSGPRELTADRPGRGRLSGPTRRTPVTVRRARGRPRRGRHREAATPIAARACSPRVAEDLLQQHRGSVDHRRLVGEARGARDVPGKLEDRPRRGRGRRAGRRRPPGSSAHTAEPPPVPVPPGSPRPASRSGSGRRRWSASGHWRTRGCRAVGPVRNRPRRREAREGQAEGVEAVVDGQESLLGDRDAASRAYRAPRATTGVGTPDDAPLRSTLPQRPRALQRPDDIAGLADERAFRSGRRKQADP